MLSFIFRLSILLSFEIDPMLEELLIWGLDTVGLLISGLEVAVWGLMTSLLRELTHFFVIMRLSIYRGLIVSYTGL